MLSIFAAAEKQTAAVVVEETVAAVVEEIAAETAAAGKGIAAEQEVVVIEQIAAAAAEIVVGSVAVQDLRSEECAIMKEYSWKTKKKSFQMYPTLKVLLRVFQRDWGELLLPQY